MSTSKDAASHTKHRVIIAILAMLTAFSPFATDTYLPGFPSIAANLNTTTTNLQLSLSIFFLGLAVGQLFYGPLTDRWGRKTPLICGIAIFIVSSLLIMFVTNLPPFIGLRFIQAVGGCSGMVISRIIIQDLFDQQESAQAFSTMMVIQGLGPVLAPIIGSVLLSYYPWQYLFLAMALFGIVCLIMAKLYIPETLAKENKKHISFATILQEFGHLLTQKNFLIPCLIGSLAVSVIFTFIAPSPDLFMTVHHLTKTQYSFAFGGIALGIAVFSQINGILLKRFTPTKIFNASVILSVLFAALLVFSLFSSSLFMTILSLFFCIGMIPLIVANSIAIAMSAFPEKAGAASSLIGVMQFGLGFICSTIPGLFGKANTYAMGFVILSCYTISLILLCNQRRQSNPVAAGTRQ